MEQEPQQADSKSPFLNLIIATGSFLIERNQEFAAKSLPKALLPRNNLRRLLHSINRQKTEKDYRGTPPRDLETGSVNSFRDTFILCDSQTYKHFEWWAVAAGFPIDQLLCTGLVSEKEWYHYFLENIDMLLNHHRRSIHGAIRVLPADLVLSSDLAIVDVLDSSRSENSIICSINTKSLSDIPSSFPISLMAFAGKDVDPLKKLVKELLILHPAQNLHQFQYLCDYFQQPHPLFDIKEHDVSLDLDPLLLEWLSPSITLERYESFLAKSHLFLPTQQASSLQDKLSPPPMIETRIYARIGLIGNPSDGFYGRTISSLIKNYWATAYLIPNSDSTNENIEFVPGYISDSIHLPSMTAGSEWTRRNGYNGTLRLFLATLSVFTDYTTKTTSLLCPERDFKCGFKVISKTNIPRQVGLAGSSALVVSFLKSLITYYKLDIPLAIQANLALSAEVDQLGIAAGHQDRVIQAYGGCVYMDFDESLMKGRGYGEYSPLSTDLLPPIWIAYVKNPKESGKVHNDIKQRFFNNDPQVKESMRKFASLATECHHLLINNQAHKIAPLFNENFECRRKLYGDAVIGAQTCSIIEIARSFGCAAKLSGSGGCVIGMPLQPDKGDHCRALKLALEGKGYIFCWLKY